MLTTWIQTETLVHVAIKIDGLQALGCMPSSMVHTLLFFMEGDVVGLYSASLHANEKTERL